MPEASKRVLGSGSPAEVRAEVIPDYFGYYKREITDLLLEGEDFKPLSTQTFELNDDLETECSDFRAERLKLTLRQGVFDLAAEVDEMVEPVFATCQLRTEFRNKKCKTSSTSSINDDLDGGSVKNGTCKENVCDVCISNNIGEPDLNSGSNANVDQGNGEVDKDLQFLLENDSSLVEEAMKKYSDKLSSRLNHMEQELESLLDSLVSKCRPMTCAEKQELVRLIKNLPRYNLDRIADILLRKKPEKRKSSNEILVELDQEDHATLWRLYYYVKAVEKAKEFSH